MFKSIQSRIFLQTLAVLAVLGWSVYLMVTSTAFVPVSYHSSYWQSLMPIQSHYVAMCLIIAVGLLIQLLLADVYFFRCGFGDSHHLMVVLWMLLLSCCGGFVSEMSPVWFSNIVLAIIISLNFDYDKGNLKSKDLLSGILTGLGALFYPPMLFVAFFVISSLIINRFSKYKDIIVYFMGIALAFLYTLCFYFLTDRLPELYQLLSEMKLYVSFTMTEAYSWKEFALLAAAALSLLYSFVILKIQYDNKQVLLRKRLMTIHLIAITSLLMMVFAPFDIHRSMGFLLIPMTLYYAMLSQMKEHPYVNDFMMLIFAVALCL